MNKRTAALLATALMLLVLGSCVLLAWEDDGTGIAVWWNTQYAPDVTSDGAGGAIFVWQDGRAVLESDIYAARFDDLGRPQWAENGVPVCTYDEDQEAPVVVSDGAGGAFVAWTDDRGDDWDIYAQRLDADGNRLWVAEGITVCAAPTDQLELQMIADGTGGVILVWEDYRNLPVTNWAIDIYAQRLDALGNALWTEGGAIVASDTANQYTPALCSDGAGGAVFAWADSRNDTFLNDWSYDIYACRLLADGSPAWTSQIVSLKYTQYLPCIAPAGDGGAIICWQDYRDDQPADIYAQRVDANGLTQWDSHGVPVVTAVEDQTSPQAVSDGSGGAIVCWNDWVSLTTDLRAQRIDADGNALWVAGGSGVPICTRLENQTLSHMISDGEGGAFICWQDSRDGDKDVYAQRLDGTGTPQWDDDGLAVCTADLDQSIPRITATGTGSAIVTWHDRRLEVPGDIYGQLITGDGDFVAAFLQEHAVQPTAEGVTLSWRLSEPAAASDFLILRGQAPGYYFHPVAETELISSDGERWILTDHSCLPGETYRYRVLYAAGGQSDESVLFESDPVALPALTLALEPNHPNPFNPTTRFGYVLPRTCQVRLEVYDAAGRLVVRLADELQSPGRHEAFWDGRNDAGRSVGSGTYLLKLHAGDEIRTRSVTLIK